MAGEIVVPLDGSRFAEAALPSAMWMARRDGRGIVLAAVSSPLLPIIEESDALDEWEAMGQEELTRYLSQTALEVEAAAEVPVRVIQREGVPTEVLSRLPAELEAGLVVMTTHGAGGLTRLWMGSVADVVARKAGVPVLLIRPAADEAQRALLPPPPFRRILIPLDGSEVAETALRKSILLGGDPEAVEILLLRILPFQPAALAVPAAADVLPPPARVVTSVGVPEALAYVDSVAAKIESWGCTVTTHVSERASPWSGISEFAAERGVDLIAMATHGRGGAARFVLGSVADRVLRSADVPVLLFAPLAGELEGERTNPVRTSVVMVP